MINKQVGQWFGSNIFRFVGSGGMMGAAQFSGQPSSAVAPSAGALIAGYGSTVVGDNPIAYWRLDEAYGYEAYDVMQVHNGLYTNGVVKGETALIADTDTFAANFDGTNDNVKTASSASPSPGNEFTLETWAFASSDNKGVCFITAEYTSASAPIPYALGLSFDTGATPTDRRLVVGHFTGAGSWNEVRDANDLPLGKTIHAVGTKDASGLAVYMNGVEVASSATTVSVVVAGSAPTFIGRRFDTGATNDFFDGTLDEVAIYDKALTATEIRKHYAIGIGYAPTSYPFHVINDGAIGYYRYGETTSTLCSTTVSNPDYWKGTYTASPTLDVSSLIANDDTSQAINLDGLSQRVVIANSFDVITDTNQYTVETWVECSSSVPGCAIIATDYPGSGRVTYALQLAGNDGSGNGTYLTTGFYDGTSWYTAVDAYSTLPIQKRLHTVGTKTSGALTVYMNGVQVGTSAVTASTEATSGRDTYIGRRWDLFGTADYFHGTVDETAIYASGLSETQVRTHYAIGVGHAPTSYPFHVIRDGAIGYWEMNETTGTESSTTVNNPKTAAGKIVGSPTLGASTGVTGSNGAFTFNGSTQYVIVSGGAATINPTGNVTAEIWAYMSTAAQGVAMSKYNFGVDAGWLLITTAGGSTSFDGRSGAGSFFTSGKSGPILNKGWSHLVGQRNGQTWKIYLNGVLESLSSSGSTGSLSNTEQPEIARLTQTNNNYFNGDLDQAAVYATAITAQAIAEHYALGIGYEEDSYHYQVIRDGVKYYWPMEETSGTSIFSITGFGKEGQFTNTPTLQSPAIFSTLGNSIHFNGSDERINLFSWETLTSATYSIAVKASAISSEQRFLALNNQNPYVMMRYVNASTIGFTMNNTGAVNLYASGIDPTDPIMISGSFKLSGMNYMYLNGALLGAASAPATGTQPTTLENRIGCSRSNTLFFNGYIDNLAIHDRQLSDAQIRSQWAALQGYASGTYQHAVITDGATGYWQLNEENGATEAPSTVGPFNGTYTGTVSAGASSIVRNGDTSLRLTAQLQSGVFIGDIDFYDRTGSHTVEWWMQTTRAAEQKCLTKELSGTNYPEFACGLNPSGQVKYVLCSANSAAGRSTLTTGASFNDGVIHHFTCVHDNTNNIQRIYVDGRVRASTTWTADTYNSTNNVTLGYVEGAVSDVGGYMSHVAIYATALASTTIVDHYDRFRPVVT